MRRWRKRIRVLLFKKAVERELDEEMAFHLQLETEKNIRAGMNPREARRQAALSFGGADRFKEQVREARATHPLSGAAQDLRIGLRSLLANRRFTFSAVALLTLGIGANATVFTSIRASLLRKLPFPDSHELVLVDLQHEETGRGMLWSWPRFRVFREQISPAEALISAYGAASLLNATPEGAESLTVEIVGREYFDVLGIRTTLGPGFSPDPDAVFQVILSDRFWRQGFGSDSEVLGRAVVLEGQSFSVVGVAAPGFAGLSGSARAWIPLEGYAVLRGPEILGAGSHWLRGIGRLQGASFESVEARTRAAGLAVQEAYPDRDPDFVVTAGLERLRDARVNPRARASLLILAGAALLVLLTACGNLGGMLVVRAGLRSRELSVRAALGAGRWRIMRAHLMEGLLLATAGSLLGLMVAMAGSQLVRLAWPERYVNGSWNLQFVDPAALKVDPAVMLFAVGLAVFSALLASALPAWRASKADPGSAIRTRPGRGGRRETRWFRGALLVGQVAITLVLLVGTHLLVATFRNLERVERGFEGRNVLTFQVTFPSHGHLAESPDEFAVPFMERLLASPGIVAGGRGCPPLGGYHCGFSQIDAFEGADISGNRLTVGLNVVDLGYFEALGITPLEGRIPHDSPMEGAGPQVLLSRSAAQAITSDGTVLGRAVTLAVRGLGESGLHAQVVGVTGEILFDTPDRGTMPEALVVSGLEPDGRNYVVRTAGNPTATLPAIRAVAREINPDVAVTQAMTLDELDRRATSDTRLALGLLGLFSVLAVIISSAGLWESMAQAVQARQQELAVRKALGEQSPRVVGRMVGQGLGLVSVGLGIGALGGWASTRLLSAQLFGVTPTDPIAFLVGVFTLTVVALAASWIPARKASQVDPMTILRSE